MEEEKISKETLKQERDLKELDLRVLEADYERKKKEIEQDIDNLSKILKGWK